MLGSASVVNCLLGQRSMISSIMGVDISSVFHPNLEKYQVRTIECEKLIDNEHYKCRIYFKSVVIDNRRNKWLT